MAGGGSSEPVYLSALSGNTISPRPPSVERNTGTALRLVILHRNAFDYLTAAVQAHLAGQPAPSLLPGV